MCTAADLFILCSKRMPYYSAMYGICAGTAQGGHYYSFIKDRRGAIGGQDSPSTSSKSHEGTTASSDKDSAVWYEFNDAYVKPFDVKDIPDECFGGEVSVS